MQILIVILIISAATFYLSWQVYKRFFAKESKCDGCAVSKITSEKPIG